jgi:hypothetical protein
MADLTVTAVDVRPLTNAITRKAVANEAMTVGDAVYIDGSSGNQPTVKKILSAVLATGNLYGVVVAGDPAKEGATAIAIGDTVDVCVYGPVTGFSGATAGGFVWGSDNAGKLADAVGTKSTIAGVMETPTILFLRPMQAVRST